MTEEKDPNLGRGIRLLHKYRNGTATPEERAVVESWYTKYASELPKKTGKDEAGVQKRVWAKLTNQPKVNRLRKWIPYAAALVLAVIGAFFLITDRQQTSDDTVATEEIQPGGNRATLTFADGRNVNLDERMDGIVVGDQVTYLDGRQVLTERGAISPEHVSDVMTIATPRGGQYRVVLGDGTEVWLNAESTLRYPGKFTGKYRQVEVEGEAYFAVAKNPEKPFRLLTQGQLIEVLGTEFNVSAYANDAAIQTTLIKGKVSVQPDGRDPVVLHPGQQAIVDSASVSIEKVNVGQYSAWKEGYFYFNGDSPEAAFAQLSRWYDIEVVYRGQVPEIAFYGEIDRNKTLGSLLNMLDKAGLNFEVVHKGNRNQLIIGHP
ncbi:iron dicitrate transporter FecR [Parapedobacter pyrenivorans]|uniref:Iron dicitrate transporter FecR n=1 Tax=Parapedobacter pyrenivorans TaxID=1305674 RepID=A0A917HZ17_9SPHI|nr:FecR family protein [Parapedobacter pyrenivorans]GGG96928.1 iron dicitrate transporter FecR [Parapedobacter pyrenivorans]